MDSAPGVQAGVSVWEAVGVVGAGNRAQVKGITRDTSALGMLLQNGGVFLPDLSERQILSCAYSRIALCQLWTE